MTMDGTIMRILREVAPAPALPSRMTQECEYRCAEPT